MRTSLKEIEYIEHFLFEADSTEDYLLFDIKTVLDKELPVKSQFQIRAYSAIQYYGRQQLVKEIDRVHNKLFTRKQHISFRQRVLKLFK